MKKSSDRKSKVPTRADKKPTASACDDRSLTGLHLHKAPADSGFHFRPYLETRAFPRMKSSDESAAATVQIAVARLDALLDQGRQQISELFTEDEFIMLLNCHQGQFLTPYECRRMASTLCDELGIEIDEYHVSPLRDFIDRLRGLTPLQSMALADALEVAWHTGPPAFERLAEMDLRFR